MKKQGELAIWPQVGELKPFGIAWLYLRLMFFSFIPYAVHFPSDILFVSEQARSTVHSLLLIASQLEASKECAAIWKVFPCPRPKKSSQQAIFWDEAASALPNMIPTGMCCTTSGA